MSADGDPGAVITSGELFRAVGLIRDDIKALRADISTRPSKADLDRVESAWEQRQQALEDAWEARWQAGKEAQAMRDSLQDKAIAAVEGWQTWALRLGAPAVVAALVGVVFNSARIGG